MKVINVVGTRPNFVKIASLMAEMKKYPKIEPVLVHTGQHYNRAMSELFFHDLDIDEPYIDLGVGSGSHATQTAQIMQRFESILIEEKPDLVLVAGDVNSTIACSLTAVKFGIPVAHVEAGLRSFDRSMPEEINRVLTDAIADFLFTTERSANENLLKEGRALENIFFVGNTMIDTLLKNKEKAQESTILQELGLVRDGFDHKSTPSDIREPFDGVYTQPSRRIQDRPESDEEMLGSARKNALVPYAVLTLHRPNNVDEADTLFNILTAIREISKNLPIFFPIHPRTKKQIETFGFSEGWFNMLDVREPFEAAQGRPELNDKISHIPNDKGIYLLEPLGYLDFLQLMSHAKLALTDSGGIQEETTVLGIPCITLRENTERPVTVNEGTNVVVGSDKGRIIEESLKAINGTIPRVKIPELWDGKAAGRIVSILLQRFNLL